MKSQIIELRGTLAQQCGFLRDARDRYSGLQGYERHVEFLNLNLRHLLEYKDAIDNYLSEREHAARQTDADNLALTQGRAASEQARTIIRATWDELKAIGK